MKTFFFLLFSNRNFVARWTKLGPRSVWRRYVTGTWSLRRPAMRLWRPSRKSFLVVRFDRQRTSSHLFYQLSSERLIRRLYIWIRRRHLLFHISCCFIGFHFLIFLSKFPPLFLLGLFLGFWFVSMIFLVFQWLSDCICFWPELFTCSIRLPLRGLIIFESSTLLLSLHITFLVLRLWCRLFYSRFFHGALRQTKQMCVSVTSPSRFLMIGFFFVVSARHVWSFIFISLNELFHIWDPTFLRWKSIHSFVRQHIHNISWIFLNVSIAW